MNHGTIYFIELSENEKAQIKEFKRNKIVDRRFYDRLMAIQLLSKGQTMKDVSDLLGKTERWVAKWRKRFFQKRLEGLNDLPRSGRPLFFSLEG